MYVRKEDIPEDWNIAHLSSIFKKETKNNVKITEG